MSKKGKLWHTVVLAIFNSNNLYDHLLRLIYPTSKADSYMKVTYQCTIKSLKINVHIFLNFKQIIFNRKIFNTCTGIYFFICLIKYKTYIILCTYKGIKLIQFFNFLNKCTEKLHGMTRKNNNDT